MVSGFAQVAVLKLMSEQTVVPLLPGRGRALTDVPSHHHRLPLGPLFIHAPAEVGICPH